jgi:hypothetical protein
MHVSCINAGNLLARLGRPEVFQCIKALEQYSYAYEETKEHAREISREYDVALQKGPNNFHQMASVINPSSRAFHAEAMSVEALTNGNGNGKHHGNTVSPFLNSRGDRLMYDALVHVDLKRYFWALQVLYYFRPRRSVTCCSLTGCCLLFSQPSCIHMDSHFRLCSYLSLPFGFIMLSK